MDYLTLKGFEQVMEQWADADPNIKSFGFGEFFNENGKPRASQVYPAVWINPVSTRSELNSLIRTFQVLIYEPPFDYTNGPDNKNAVVSECEEYAFRLIRFLRKKSEIFDISGTPVIRPFTDRFFDDVSGVIIDMDIEFNAIQSDCYDPDYSFQITKINVK